ncbi:MAG: VWA domain-containing protein [SAR324 cluster bacterium]|nr:VWA domain-containing protein [SAR324 cluster bacterium]
MVTPNSLNGALEALSWVDTLDLDQFKTALLANLVQHPLDMDCFEAAFTDYFLSQNNMQLEKEDQFFKANLKDFIDQVKKSEENFDAVIIGVLEGKSRGVMQLLIEAEESFLTHDAEDHKKGKGGQKKKNTFKKQLKMMIDLAEDFSARSFHMPQQKREKLAEIIRQQLEEAMALLDNKPQGRDKLLPWEKENTISTINFAQLREADISKVKEEVNILARKLKNKLAQKQKRSAKGKIDIKAMVRQSAAYGGVPFKLRWKQHKKTKGKIIAICDVSSSVSYAAQFMILLLYLLQSRFSKIRSFVFIRQAYEITSFFESWPLEQAMLKAIDSHKIRMGQPSNYGSSFNSFLKDYGSAVTPDTTLIIMGDGQNNFNAPQIEGFKTLSERAAKTYWLNPEEEKFWYSASNVSKEYKPFCDQMIECATLEQLGEFTEKLVF